MVAFICGQCIETIYTGSYELHTHSQTHNPQLLIFMHFTMYIQCKYNIVVHPYHSTRILRTYSCYFSSSFLLLFSVIFIIILMAHSNLSIPAMSLFILTVLVEKWKYEKEKKKMKWNKMNWRYNGTKWAVIRHYVRYRAYFFFLILHSSLSAVWFHVHGSTVVHTSCDHIHKHRRKYFFSLICSMCSVPITDVLMNMSNNAHFNIDSRRRKSNLFTKKSN